MAPDASHGYAAMTATLSREPLRDPGWTFERKLDGVRCGVVRRGGEVTLVSRTGHALTRTFPEVAAAFDEGPDAPDLVVDAEVVAYEDGRQSFARLQGRSGRTWRADEDPVARTGIAVWCYAFDLLEVDGHDLRGRPLFDRRRLLRAALPDDDRVRTPSHREEDGVAAFREACANGWEGVVAKRLDAPYRSARSRDWRKIKCEQAQELVVGGWTAPRGSRTELGALLLGHFEEGRLRYAGRVGTGFDRAELARLGEALRARERRTSPFVDRDVPRDARFCAPELVVQVSFAEWTRDGRLRHPRYLGRREDRAPADVVRERPSD